MLDQPEFDGTPNLTRVRNGSAEAATWVDPNDLNPNKRAAAQVSGLRAVDGLYNLLKFGSIGRSQFAAGARYRKAWETGVAGLLGSSVERLGLAPGGVTDGDPSERRLGRV